ncbi:MAG: ribosome-associated translation inhibitor RaiA [Clostridia bacterium]|nr:ribosome-associated translation inhibitor RaiA [Clostridia bacterium]
MKLDITGLRIEVTDAFRDFTEKKVQKLAKFFEPETICHVTFTEKSKGKQHIDIRIEYRSRTYLAEENCEDIYYGLESLITKIEGQIRKDKDISEKKRKETIANPVSEDVEDMLEE